MLTWPKRIFFFAVTNMLVIGLMTVVCFVFGIDAHVGGELNLLGLLVFSAVLQTTTFGGLAGCTRGPGPPTAASAWCLYGHLLWDAFGIINLLKSPYKTAGLMQKNGARSAPEFSRIF